MANAAQERTTERWRGLLLQQVQVPADKAWSVIREFGGLSKWAKNINACELIEGEESKPGCVRSLRSGGPGPEQRWAKERLTLLDDENKREGYEVLDNNLGLAGYQAWMKVDHLDDNSCMVTWNFETNPTKGFTEEAVAQMMTQVFRGMLNNLEEYLSS